MQTFLPDPSFARSAAALDDRRLGKQRVETVQILRALVWPAYGWKHHPAVAMWRGFVPALALYGLVVCDEWERRGGADSVRGQLLAFTGGEPPDPAALVARGSVPPWLGDPALHRSHRAALLRKEPERYRPLFGDEPDDLPYVWPAPLFPRWPVTASDVAGLSLDDAWRATGRARAARAASTAGRPRKDADPPLRLDERRALRRILEHAAEDTTDAAVVELVVADRARGVRVAVLAGLLTPGVTVWLSPPPAVEPTLTASPRRVAPGYGAGRAPDAATVRAMRREADAEAEFRFHPVTAPGAAAGAGLVVLDGVDPGGVAVADGTPVLRLRPA